ncbi:RyR domain-containing protein [Actinomycetospora aeridis]|uniref:RyR domain-containing protein n=1 Tax=Actinomycetospora aeridis TaxID=3129231 RepID=A0ABU8N0K7_9PSEU
MTRVDGDRLSTTQVSVRVAIGVNAVVAAVLGVIGFVRYLPTQADYVAWGWTDVAYYTLQLFLLDSAPLQKAAPLPVVLDVARFLAPATTALALGASVLAVYHSTYHAVRARRLHHHTVVCGDGAPALRVARAALEENRSCVIISATSTSSEPAPGGHAEAVLRIGGDPRDAAVLREARIDRAAEVVIVTGDNGRNTDIAASVRTALRDVATPPPCFLEMGSPELAIALAAHELNSGSAVRTEFFDPAGRAARLLVDAHLPVSVSRSVVLVGSGRQHEALVDELERRCSRAVHPWRWASLEPAELQDYEVPDDLALAVVSAPDDAGVIRLGLRVLRRLRACAVDVVVATGSSTALGTEVAGDTPVSRIDRARLLLFNVADHVYSLSSLRDGIYLDIARAAHEAYVRQARARGETEHSHPSTLPWPKLPDDLKTANIRQAHSVGEKLRGAGLAVVPSDGTESTFAFEGAELDRLAKEEHERWRAERTEAGWTYGPRDDAAKTHPDLVPWPKLPPGSRQKDVDAVADIPHQLRGIGLQILRVGR